MKVNHVQALLALHGAASPKLSREDFILPKAEGHVSHGFIAGKLSNATLRSVLGTQTLSSTPSQDAAQAVFDQMRQMFRSSWVLGGRPSIGPTYFADVKSALDAQGADTSGWDYSVLQAELANNHNTLPPWRDTSGDFKLSGGTRLPIPVPPNTGAAPAPLDAPASRPTPPSATTPQAVAPQPSAPARQQATATQASTPSQPAAAKPTAAPVKQADVAQSSGPLLQAPPPFVFSPPSKTAGTPDTQETFEYFANYLANGTLNTVANAQAQGSVGGADVAQATFDQMRQMYRYNYALKKHDETAQAYFADMKNALDGQGFDTSAWDYSMLQADLAANTNTVLPWQKLGDYQLSTTPAPTIPVPPLPADMDS